MRWFLPFVLVALHAHAAWTLDLEQSELAVKVFKAGAASSFAHDHIIRAGKVTGEGSLNEAGEPQSLQLSLAVDVASLTPDEPETRRRYHLPNTPLKDDDRAKVKEHMLDEGQLDVKRFPRIEFKLTGVRAGAEGGVICTGELTLHGVTKPVTMAAKLEREGDMLRGAGKVRFNTSDFGIKPYSAALGLVRNKDEVELHARISLRHVEP